VSSWKPLANIFPASGDRHVVNPQAHKTPSSAKLEDAVTGLCLERSQKDTSRAECGAGKGRSRRTSRSMTGVMKRQCLANSGKGVVENVKVSVEGEVRFKVSVRPSGWNYESTSSIHGSPVWKRKLVRVLAVVEPAI